jgi:hypothetical protein
MNEDGDYTDAGENTSIMINVNCNNCEFNECTVGICFSCPICSGPGSFYVNQFDESRCLNAGQSCDYSCVEGKCGMDVCPGGSPPTNTTNNSFSYENNSFVVNSAGCSFSEIVCPSAYTYCVYKFMRFGMYYPDPVFCDLYTTRPNPGILVSGESLCPEYDFNKGFGSTIQCQVVGYIVQ